MISFLKGNMFDHEANVRVNAVNCFGVMGKGIALEFKGRYPEMFLQYKEDCKKSKYHPGIVIPYYGYSGKAGEVILNAATKFHWRKNSSYQWVSSCISNIKDYLIEMHNKNCKETIKVTMPLLGCGNGGLSCENVKKMISKSFSDFDFPIDIKVFQN